MNKKLLIIVVILIVCIGAGFTYLLLRNGPKSAAVESDQPVESSAPATSEQPMEVSATAESPGVYTDYNEQKLAQTAGTKILFFHAPWCPQCRQLEADIKKGVIPAGVTVFKVDYDSNQKLRQKYGVSLQTTLVLVDDNGNLVKKFVAYDEPTLAALIRNLL